ncbi:hypothetical protein ACJX0J_014987, partial [Zea mays]
QWANNTNLIEWNLFKFSILAFIQHRRFFMQIAINGLDMHIMQQHGSNILQSNELGRLAMWFALNAKILTTFFLSF